MTTQTEYPIGTKFNHGGKVNRLCTVVDIYKTYNHAGELVKTAYMAEHEFMGQVIRAEYPIVSIQRGQQ